MTGALPAQLAAIAPDRGEPGALGIGGVGSSDIEADSGGGGAGDFGGTDDGAGGAAAVEAEPGFTA